jgi:4-amino-4-deoxy-L-arabinose transferase-like glycosyltransferase
LTATISRPSDSREPARLKALKAEGGRRRFWGRLTAIAVAGLALRIGYVLTIAKRDPNGGDPFYYHTQANLIAAGHGFAEPFTWTRFHVVVPSAFHPPLFSLVLAATSWLGGTSYLAHKLTACLIGTATVVVVGLTGREIGGHRAGLVAAGLAATYPNLWVADGILMPETLDAFTIALVVLAGVRLASRPSSRRAALLGGAVGLASLARGEGVLLVPLVVVPLLWQATRRGLGPGAAIRELGVAVVVAAAVVTPWTLRNLRTFDHPVPIAVNGEEVIGTANCNLAWYGPLVGFWDFGCYHGFPPGDESDRAAYFAHQGVTYIGQHLGRAPVVVAARVGRIWDVYRPIQNTTLDTIEGRDVRISRAGLAAYAALMPLALVGAVILRRRGVSVVVFAGLAATVTAVAVYAYGSTRFRTPAEVAVVLLAAVTIDWAIDRAINRAGNRPATGPVSP